MSWKFWTWPAQIKSLRDEKERYVLAWKENSAEINRLRATLKLLQDCPTSLPLPPPRPLPIPAHDLQLLQNRVACLAADDPLWPMLVALLRRNMQTDLEALAPAGIGDEEAHRGRGRIGMILDLEAQFNQLWQDTHRQVEKEEKPAAEG